jgi:hypothetical protein
MPRISSRSRSALTTRHDRRRKKQAAELARQF